MTKKITYLETHPWIKFEADLRMAGFELWILAGEAKNQCEQIANVPLKPSVAKRLSTIYLTKGVKGTIAIEGNTLTEEQVQQRIEGKLELPPSQEYLGKEADNIISAVNSIANKIAREPSSHHDLSLEQIKSFNNQVLHDLTVDEGVVPGEIPKFPVGVMHYRGAPREECEYLLERLCEWLNGKEFDFLDKENEGKIVSAIFKSIIAHLYIAWIHPFGDGNGRSARLVEFFILFKSGVPSIAAHLLSNHYNLTRNEYYRQLDIASKSGGDIIPFLRYALRGFVDGLREQLNTIKAFQQYIAWENYVHESFQAKSTKTHKRRRNLVLALSLKPEAVPLNKITLMTPATAADYAGRSTMTLMRDLARLKKMGLIEHGPGGYRARREIILAFLPFPCQPEESQESN